MPGKRGRPGVDLPGAGDRDPELVLGPAGRDLGVGPGVDVRVDADRDRRLAAAGSRDLGERLELGLRLDVEAQDAVVEGVGHLGAGLGDPGEHDPLARDSGREGPAQLARPTRCPCRRRAPPGSRGPPGSSSPSWRSRRAHRCPRTLPRRRGSAARGSRRNSSRTACRRGRERLEADALGVQDAVAVGEMVHRRGVRAGGRG